MSATFVMLAVLTVVSAVAVMLLRNLVHCALALAVTFAGLAGIYLQLNAQFVGFAQLLVYVGAVAILIVFAILLTRGREPPLQSVFSGSAIVGFGIAIVVFAVLATMTLSSRALGMEKPGEANASVAQIGEQLMTRYILPLEVAGLLLTVALIGAVIIAMRDKEPE
ncbi:MAG: NADH-quinone oxidoreductase subunit J [Verrucomicrobia bacterium]|nr:MAG: NADH-quinone oxidoreductase subunit J [Verrucomicrobiota bacterium]